MNKVLLPQQIETLINSLLNRSDSVYLRSNYRMRLDVMRNEIDKAIRSYDNEVLLADASKTRRKRDFIINK